MRTTQEWDQLSGLVTLWSQQAKQAGENGDRMARALYYLDAIAREHGTTLAEIMDAS